MAQADTNATPKQDEDENSNSLMLDKDEALASIDNLLASVEDPVYLKCLEINGTKKYSEIVKEIKAKGNKRNHAYHVYGRIFIGGRREMCNIEENKNKFNIKYVLNLAHDIEFEKGWKDSLVALKSNFNYYGRHAEDDMQYDILQHDWYSNNDKNKSKLNNSLRIDANNSKSTPDNNEENQIGCRDWIGNALKDLEKKEKEKEKEKDEEKVAVKESKENKDNGDKKDSKKDKNNNNGKKDNNSLLHIEYEAKNKQNDKSEIEKDELNNPDYSNSGNILICCRGGINRSGFTVAATLVEFYNLDCTQTMKILRAVKFPILTNEGFVKKLVEMWRNKIGDKN